MATLAAWLIGVCGSVFAQDVDVPAGRIVGEGQMQFGRYTTTVAAPAEAAARPLDVYVQLSYPRQTVQTVGDALRHTLLRTGWRLMAPSALAPQAAHLLGLPLPESQRVMGPYRARTVLQVLTGPSWQWHEDPVQRLVWFTPVPTEIAAQAATAQSTPVESPDATARAVATAVTDPSVQPRALPQQNGPALPDESQ